MNEPENRLPSENARRKRSHLTQFHVREMSRTGESKETESRLVVARG